MVEVPRRARDRRWSHPAILVGGGLLGVILLLTAAAPWIAPHNPHQQQDLLLRKLPPGSVVHVVALRSGEEILAERIERTEHSLLIERRGRRQVIPVEEVLNVTDDGVTDRRYFLLGTDGISRDILSRILYGGRISLAIGLLSILIALTLGVAVGSLAATSSRWLDSLLMRGVDAALAFPALFLLLTLSSLFDASLWLFALLLGGTAWMSISRLIRADLLGLRERDFVLAARASGLGRWRILRHHLIPNAWSPVVIQATLLLGDIVLIEAALSFLHMGVQPPTPTWGNMIADGQTDLRSAWWISTFPGIALGVTVIAVNLLADGFRDVLEPRHR